MIQKRVGARSGKVKKGLSAERFLPLAPLPWVELRRQVGSLNMDGDRETQSPTKHI